MGYDIVMCKVLEVDLKTRRVSLEPLNSQFIDTINSDASSGLKFASSYAPYISAADPKTQKINNVPSGVVNYPQPGDMVLALVWMSDITAEDRLYTSLSQNPLMEVIILAHVHWDHMSIGPYDHIIGDQSGAKIHLNHGWLDTTNIANPLPDYLEAGKAAQPHQLRSGHVTLVGNRLVSLSGKKFLPFGLFSHLLGQAGNLNPTVFPETTDSGTGGKTGMGTPWGGEEGVFTKDPTDTSIFDKLPDAGGVGNGKFLEPPCPEPGAMMNMHDSGYKLLVSVNGHVREYVPKGRLIIIGQDDSPFREKKMSFDPVGQSESSTYPDVAEGVLEIHLVSQGDSLKIKFDPTGKEVTLTTTSGKFKVVGNIEATLDVKGATGTFG